MGTGAL